MKIKIDPDIRKAETLPAEFYRSKVIFEELKKKVFAKCWHFVANSDALKIPGTVYPFTLMEEYLNEPLLLTRGLDDKVHCLSNVCTHRGNILVENGDVVQNMRCRYHGRRFELNGCFRSMPECEDAVKFPRKEDDLSKVPFEFWHKFIFTSINPVKQHQDFFKPITERLEGVKLGEMTYEPSRSRDYLVRCNWALYVENYLEGFHIPYVHSSLNEVIDYGAYTDEIYDFSTLQLGVAKPGEECFTLTEISPDYGTEVAAYYWWVFPNMMFNFYPWGLSINIVRPLAIDLTKVSFLTYVSDRNKLDKGAGAGLDRVEREDEAIVEMVQKGMQSSFYSRGRYSPKREKGVHHFHRLLTGFLNNE